MRSVHVFGETGTLGFQFSSVFAILTLPREAVAALTDLPDRPRGHPRVHHRVPAVAVLRGEVRGGAARRDDAGVGVCVVLADLDAHHRPALGSGDRGLWLIVRQAMPSVVLRSSPRFSVSTADRDCAAK